MSGARPQSSGSSRCWRLHLAEGERRVCDSRWEGQELGRQLWSFPPTAPGLRRCPRGGITSRWGANVCLSPCVSLHDLSRKESRSLCVSPPPGGLDVGTLEMPPRTPLPGVGGGRWPGSGAFSPEVPRPHRPFNLYVSLSLGLSLSLLASVCLSPSPCVSVSLAPSPACLCCSPQCQKVSDVCGRDFGTAGGFSGQREEEGIYEFAQGASGQETLTPEASGCQVLGFRRSGGRRGHLPSPRGTGSPRPVWEALGGSGQPHRRS